MRSLQVKIALILIGSIVAVIMVATGVTAVVMSSGDSTRMIGPTAEHIAFSIDMLASKGTMQPPPHPREEVKPAPADGTVREDLTAALKAALEREGKTGTVIVTEDSAGGQPSASYQLPDGRWAIYSFPRQGPPPSGLWVPLASWMALVAFGVVVVALVMARRVTQPFGMLERAVASVGADGVLPHLPETGSGEARHTAAALNKLSDRLRTSMESRMRLIAAAGHDLRTPMTRMRLRAEFLPDEERASWLADLDELDLIADSAIRLVREEGAREDQQVVELEPLVVETVRELSAAKLPVALAATQRAVIKAGPLSLKRALRNLITNAATHGGGARVSLAASEGFAQIVIDDDGPGIPEELMSQVFEPFFRVDAGRRKALKGAGLGLAIAKEIIERSGGSIEIENRPDGGLRQTVTLSEVKQ